jgi:hypothetical protein
MLEIVCGVPPHRVSRYAGTDVTRSKLKYLAYFPVQGVFRASGMDVNLVCYIHVVLGITVHPSLARNTPHRDRNQI